MKKLKKLSEQADLITDNKDGAQAEQIHKLKQMVKKVDMSKKKRETTYVKAKRGET
jgi:Cu/Ag efflux protein CusF